MSDNFTFDMTDVRVRWQLYRYQNRRHDGEIWLAFRTPTGILLMEQSGRWPEPKTSELLGEVRTRVIDGELVDDIIPLRQRSPEELARLHEEAMEHRRYRAELYKRYSWAERVADLDGKNFVEAKQVKPT
jgi:hypothetical protein